MYVSSSYVRVNFIRVDRNSSGNNYSSLVTQAGIIVCFCIFLATYNVRDRCPDMVPRQFWMASKFMFCFMSREVN